MNHISQDKNTAKTYSDIITKNIEVAKQKTEKIFKQFGMHQIKLPSGLCWYLNGEYFRIDFIYFPKKPFLVIEWTDNLEQAKNNCFEDTDPFPYDLDNQNLIKEIKKILSS